MRVVATKRGGGKTTSAVDTYFNLFLNDIPAIIVVATPNERQHVESRLFQKIKKHDPVDFYNSFNRMSRDIMLADVFWQRFGSLRSCGVKIIIDNIERINPNIALITTTPDFLYPKIPKHKGMTESEIIQYLNFSKDSLHKKASRLGFKRTTTRIGKERRNCWVCGESLFLTARDVVDHFKKFPLGFDKYYWDWERKEMKSYE